jgi:chromate transporter
LKEFLDIFLAFTVIGASTFGGGYAMVPVLERELIQKRRWITMDEVIDYYTIAQITPGIITVNMATFVGYKRKGVLGGIIATIAVVLPGVCLMILFSFFIKRFTGYALVRRAFAGVRIAVGALILDTVLKLLKGFFKDCRLLVIGGIAFALSALFSLSPVWIILGAAGFLLFAGRPKAAPPPDPPAAGGEGGPP